MRACVFLLGGISMMIVMEMIGMHGFVKDMLTVLAFLSVGIGIIFSIHVEPPDADAVRGSER